MANVTVYLKCDRNVEVQSEDVFLSDVGSLRCMDSVIAAKLKALKVHHFSSGDTKRCVISSLHLVKLMEEFGLDADPELSMDHIISIYPDAGDKFLLFRKQ